MAVNVNESSSIKTLSKVLQNESNRVKTDDSVYTNNSGTLIKLFPYDRTLDAWNWAYWDKSYIKNARLSNYDNNHGCRLTLNYGFPKVSAHTEVRRGERFKISVLSEARGYYGNPVDTEGIDTDFPMVWVERQSGSSRYYILSDEQQAFNSTYGKYTKHNVLQANTSSSEPIFWIADEYYVTKSSFVTFSIPDTESYYYNIHVSRLRVNGGLSTYNFYVEFLNQ